MAAVRSTALFDCVAMRITRLSTSDASGFLFSWRRSVAAKVRRNGRSVRMYVVLTLQVSLTLLAIHYLPALIAKLF